MSGAHPKPWSARRSPPRPDRIRRIERGFAVLPNRFLHDGFFSSLSHAERSLYLFLVLAADRSGVSFYPYDRICSALKLSPDQYVQIRDSLIHKDLIAFDGSNFQVLELPPKPILQPRPPTCRRQDVEQHNPVTLDRLLRATFRDR